MCAVLELNCFNITVKCHYLLHAACQGRYLHPKKTWCFAGEDFMKHSKRLVGACCRSMSATNVVSKFCKKYQTAMFLAIAQDEQFSPWYRP